MNGEDKTVAEPVKGAPSVYEVDQLCRYIDAYRNETRRLALDLSHRERAALVYILKRFTPTKNNAIIAAAPDLAEAIAYGPTLELPDFLEWIADRLVNVHGESPNVDFVLSLRERAKRCRAALSKARGER